MLAGQGGEAFDAQQLAPLSKELTAEFHSIANDALAQLHRSRHVPYSAGRKPERYEAAITTLAEVPPLQVALNSIERYGDLSVFDLGGEMSNRVDLYIVAVAADSGPMHFLRRTAAKKRLRQTNKIHAIWRGQAFETLQDDPLVLDTNFDAIVDGEGVYILNQTNFERSLGFLEGARKAAETTVRAAISNLALANPEELVAAVTSDMNMVSKTRSIAERLTDPEYAQRMTVDNLLAVSEQHSEIDFDWDIDDDGNKQLVFHTDPQRRWQILKILDDDYLQSLVTQWVYEANSKHQIR